MAAVGRLAIPLCSLDAIHGDPLFLGEDYPEIKLGRDRLELERTMKLENWCATSENRNLKVTEEGAMDALAG